MEEIYKNQLFARCILVNDSKEKVSNNFEALFSLANLLNIKIVDGTELASLDVFKYASKMLGENVPEPFYKGFPESVRELSPEKRLFDQLVHYTITYGFGDFSEAGHSLFEENFERIAFKEKTKIKEFIIVDEKGAICKLEEIVENLLASTRPLSKDNFNFVEKFITDFSYEIKDCKSKNTQILLLLHTKNYKLVKNLALSDFIKIVEQLNYENYNSKKLKKLNLKNSDRKFLTKVLDLLLEGDFNIRDCYEKQQYWCGILHHIHYKAKNEKAQEFLNEMRGGENHSVYSEFERLIGAGDVKSASDYLLKNKGTASVIRNLNYLISRAKNQDEIEDILNIAKTKNNIVLIQNMLQYSKEFDPVSRNFKFVKFNKLKVHIETGEEVKRRKTYLPKATSKFIFESFKKNLENNLRNKLGKVYIDDGMELIAVPIQESTSSLGFNVLPKGSKVIIGDMKKIRAFVYWEKVNDIDLSAVGLDEKMNQTEFSWRNMFAKQDGAITFSGDITSGFNGASEYFDIDVKKFMKEYPKIKYLVFSANVYSGTTFSECICRAGFMQRDIKDSGQIYEPKTVETAFDVNGDSTFEYLFAIDLKNNQVIWLNTTKDSNQIVAGATNLSFLTDYFNMTKILNLKDLFTMMAESVTDNIADADVVVSDKYFDNKDNKDVYRTCDIDKILKLINE